MSQTQRVLTLAAWVLFVAWAVRYVPLGQSLSQPFHHAILSTGMGPLQWLLLSASLLAGAASLLLSRIDLDATGRGLAVCLACALSPFWVSFGHILLMLASAAVLAVVMGTLLDRPKQWDAPHPLARSPWLWGGSLYILCFALHALFSIHRHRSFGSGAWDLGCMVHNFHLASYGYPTISTVLGGVDFLGDHFMPGIYLFSPLFWADGSGTTVLLLQAASLSTAGPTIYGIGRRHGASRPLAWVLGLVTGLSFGLQSAAYFDAHGITIGFAFLTFALWAIEKGRLAGASAALLLFALFKESVGPYVIGLGLFLLVQGYRSRDPRFFRFGLAWVVAGAVWFVLVVRVFMPAFEARGAPRANHETFAEFGPTVFAAFLGILKDPFRALGALFVPKEKLSSLATTLGGTGALCLVSWEVVLAASPLLAERFLSSNPSMWHMGYHYAAPLCLYAGWGSARALPRIEPWVKSYLSSLSFGRSHLSQRMLGIYLVLAALLVCGFGYSHPSNYFTWTAPYFSKPDKLAANRSAVALVRSLGRDVSVAAQNRILPHLADRPQIWRLGEYHHADIIVIAVNENAWPYDQRFPDQTERALQRSPEFRRVFEQARTSVFVRVGSEAERRVRTLDRPDH